MLKAHGTYSRADFTSPTASTAQRQSPDDDSQLPCDCGILLKALENLFTEKGFEADEVQEKMRQIRRELVMMCNVFGKIAG